tara:strand:+ start:253 stop:420 length:168 start_codon:yes stop_codon:yes gene_type:complete
VSWGTEEKAISAGKHLGIKGVHQLENGQWMPGTSHEIYAEALRKPTKKKKKGKKK